MFQKFNKKNKKPLSRPVHRPPTATDDDNTISDYARQLLIDVYDDSMKESQHNTPTSLSSHTFNTQPSSIQMHNHIDSPLQPKHTDININIPQCNDSVEYSTITQTHTKSNPGNNIKISHANQPSTIHAPPIPKTSPVDIDHNGSNKNIVEPSQHNTIDVTDLAAPDTDVPVMTNEFNTLDYSVDQYINNAMHSSSSSSNICDTSTYHRLFEKLQNELQQKLHDKNDELFDAMEYCEDLQKQFQLYQHTTHTNIQLLNNQLNQLQHTIDYKKYSYIMQTDQKRQSFEQSKIYIQLYHSTQTKQLPHIYTQQYITQLNSKCQELCVITKNLHKFIQLYESCDDMNQLALKLIHQSYQCAISQCYLQYESLYTNNESTEQLVDLLSAIAPTQFIQYYITLIYNELDSAVKQKSIMLSDKPLIQQLCHQFDSVYTLIYNIIQNKLIQIRSMFMTQQPIINTVVEQLINHLYHSYLVQYINNIIQLSCKQSATQQLYLFDQLLKYIKSMSTKLQLLVTEQYNHISLDMDDMLYTMLQQHYLSHVNNHCHQQLTQLIQQNMIDTVPLIDTMVHDTTTQQQWNHAINCTEQTIQSIDTTLRQCINRLHKLYKHNNTLDILNELYNNINHIYFSYYNSIYQSMDSYYNKFHSIEQYTHSVILYIHNTSQFIQYINQQFQLISNRQYVQHTESNITKSLNTIQSYHITRIQLLLKHESRHIYHQLDDNDNATPTTIDTINYIKLHLNTLQNQLVGVTYDIYVISFIIKFYRCYIELLQQYQVNALGSNLLNRNIQYIYDELTIQYSHPHIHTLLYNLTQVTCIYYVQWNELKSMLYNTKQGKYIIQHYNKHELLQLLQIRTDYINNKQQCDIMLNSM